MNHVDVRKPEYWSLCFNENRPRTAITGRRHPYIEAQIEITVRMADDLQGLLLHARRESSSEWQKGCRSCERSHDEGRQVTIGGDRFDQDIRIWGPVMRDGQIAGPLDHMIGRQDSTARRDEEPGADADAPLSKIR